MAPQYKLTYFNLKALVEPTRLLFAHANVEYEDDRIDFNTWSTVKPTMPWGMVPVLQDGDLILSQSQAILKYLGKKLGYAGDNDAETAKCDEYCGAMQDFNEVCVSFGHEKDPEKKAEKEKKMREEAFPHYLSKFNEILKKNGDFLVGEKLTYADFYVGHFIQVSLLLESNFLDGYPELKRHQEMIFNLPGIKEWVEKRPVTQW